MGGKRVACLAARGYISSMKTPLPIDEVLPRLREALRGSVSVVLSAPPGAGKTTRVPPALLDEEWLSKRKLIMLEPRRLAAQRSAEYMARQLGERVGGSVGYRIRGESRVSSATRIEVVTEGVLTRMLQHAPDLPDAGLVVFDEFHERSLHADLGLALTLDTQAHLREDLKILVMSATLDNIAVRDFLGGVPVIESPGRSYPVETVYRQFPSEKPLGESVCEAVLRALRETEGDLLVFLPGRGEIRRVTELLADAHLPEEARVCPLYGDAPPRTQRAALDPSGAGERKIILATSIAETSLTIDGVRVVIDAGLSRRPEFNPRRGMAGLVTVPVSKASAEQRRGRAGRQSPGVCYRLWTEEAHAGLPAFALPEMLTSDLAPLALDLAVWGVPDGRGLRFLDPPPTAHLAQAQKVLKELDALDEEGNLTSRGREMAALPVHPRLAHMIVMARGLGLAPLACDIAALLEEGDIVRGRGDIDLRSRLAALQTGEDVEAGVRARVIAEARRLRRLSAAGEGVASEGGIGILLALAYPERVGRRRADGGRRYELVNGSGAVLPEWSLLRREEYIAVAEVDGVGTDVHIHLASPVSRQDLADVFADRLLREDQVHWDPLSESVVGRRVLKLGSLVLGESPLKVEENRLRDALLGGIRAMGLESLPWSREARALRARSEWLRSRGLAPNNWPDLSDEALMEDLPRWLGPWVGGMSRRSDLSALDLRRAISARFEHQQLGELDRLAPVAVLVPSGSRIRIEYGTGSEPALSVKLQEMLGETRTPTVAGGRVKVVLHLLSPAGRPLAVTQDLPSFWKNVYPEVRKEMRGRYPKHYWPENPLSARPTKRIRKPA